MSQTTCGSTLAYGRLRHQSHVYSHSSGSAYGGDYGQRQRTQQSAECAAYGYGHGPGDIGTGHRYVHAEKVGKSSPAKVFTLANKQSVAITGILISTTGDFSFSTTTCSSSLAAKSSCKINVIFTPTQTGTRTGTLQVSDSTVTSPQTTNLSGTGE